MNFRKLFSLLFILFINIEIFAQQDIDPILENIIEKIAENANEDFDYSELYERLNYYKNKPLNINKATKKDFQELFFLNPLQINSILEHIANNGVLIDILELQGIENLDLETIKLLLYFSTISSSNYLKNISIKHLKQESKNDLMLRFGKILQEQQGYTIPDTSSKSRYLGNSDKIFARYRFNYLNNILFSLNIEKDAGEKFWSTSKNKGFDFVSSSLYIKDISKFKKIVLGDFSLQFGQGLTLWSGLSFGKNADIFSLAKQDLGLRPYTSVNEYSFFRGIATELNFNKVAVTLFYSNKNLDASHTFNADLNSFEVSSLQITGLHRTPTELSNKKIVNQQVFGTNIQYNYKTLSIGLTAYQTLFNLPFNEGDKLYNQFDFKGKMLNNIGVNYSKSYKNIYFFGETAYSLNSGFASINGAIASVSNKVSLIALHRYYQKNYQSFFNQAISENTNAVNEKGFYGGFNYKAGKKYELNIYTDLFKFPWLKFRVDAPSTGYEILSQFNYNLSKTTQLILRYKLEEKQQNIGINYSNNIESIKKQNYRLEIRYQISKALSLKNRVEIVDYKIDNQGKSYGYLVYQDVYYKNLNSKFSGNIRYALFDTEGFDTRIYSFENDVLYGYSIPALQNKGTRVYLNGRYRFYKSLDFWLKYSITNYINQETIGTGLEQINGNNKSEIRVQLRYLF